MEPQSTHPATPSGLPNSARFGQAIAADGARVVVAHIPTSGSGALYFYEWDESSSSWASQGSITSIAGLRAGTYNPTVELVGDCVFLGLPELNSNAGHVYAYRYDGSTWSRVPGSVSIGNGVDDGFGAALAANGGHLAVGNPNEGDGMVYAYGV